MIMQQKLIILRGMPTLSKLAKAKELIENAGGGFLCGADMYFEDKSGEFRFDVKQVVYSYEWCRRHVALALDSGYPLVVVNNPFVKQWEVDKYKRLAKNLGAKVEVITDHSSLIADPTPEQNFRTIPKETWDRMLKDFEM